MVGIGIAFVALLGYSSLPQSGADTCLMFAAQNIAKGSGNFYCYVQFSDQPVKIRKGDRLTYEVYLAPQNKEPKGGIDIDAEGVSLRDSGSLDQFGLRAHGDALLPQSIGKWLRRNISLDKLADHTANRWNLQFESDLPGTFVQFIDKVEIEHADGTKATIYDNGQPKLKNLIIHEGYSRTFVLRQVSKDEVKDSADLSDLISRETASAMRMAKLDSARFELEIAAKIAKEAKDPNLAKTVEASRLELDSISAESATDESIKAVLEAIQGRMKGPYPVVKSFQTDLVGYGHIDFQWLWNWPETVDVTRATFKQAAKFMDEYTDFRFTMSGSLLYKAVEDNDPDLFKKIQEKVKNGQWEIVGGRMTEADTNIISPESHARQFLYGQAYFKEKFGKQATVGFEPDTFGHTLQMPQILKLGGCDSYYFCRTGAHLPLFWWQSPDGSKVLAFDDEANGAWYTSDLGLGRFDNLFKYQKATGKKEAMWMYGVGNHGGGPTRENIEMARDWQTKSYLPAARFSTISDYFANVRKSQGPSLSVHKGDLNTVFEGCYTSHGDVKALNREAEATTESAEALAAMASLSGFEYPTAEFRKIWEGILWNQHHDTIDGSAINSSYQDSRKVYEKAIASSKAIEGQATDWFLSKMNSEPGDIAIFNPTGFARKEVVFADAKSLARMCWVGKWMPQQLSDGKWAVLADGIPSFGYRTFEPRPFMGTVGHTNIFSPSTTALFNGHYRVVVDPATGLVTSIKDVISGYEGIAKGGSGNRLEIHWEKPGGMSAWNIQEISKVEALNGPIEIKVLENGPLYAKIGWTRQFGKTALVQTISLSAYGKPEFSVSTRWNELGHGDTLNPFLKVAFDVNAKNPTQTYDIPFGTIQREANGHEYPALKWVDLADSKGGAALVNNNKHGYSAKGNTLYLSLIRSSYDPDPTPNNYDQSAKWLFVPHAKSWKESGILQVGQAFNHPLIVKEVVALNKNGAYPSSKSFVDIPGSNLLATCLKVSESGAGLVVRFYEAFGSKTPVSLKVNGQRISGVRATNLLEQAIKASASVANPYEIKTLEVGLGRK